MQVKAVIVGAAGTASAALLNTVYIPSLARLAAALRRPASSL